MRGDEISRPSRSKPPAERESLHLTSGQLKPPSCLRKTGVLNLAVERPFSGLNIYPGIV